MKQFKITVNGKTYDVAVEESNGVASAPAAAPAAPTGPVAAAVIMPKAGISVESCIIGSWQKKVGDQVKIGDILFTYETDKASFECESTAEGELLDNAHIQLTNIKITLVGGVSYDAN